MDATHTHSIQFRLDDDDAVNCTFVERLKTDAATGVIDYANKPRFALDYARGYAIRPSDEGLQAEELVRNLWTPALAAVFKTSAKNTIMNFGHHKLDQHMPVISVGTHPCSFDHFMMKTTLHPQESWIVSNSPLSPPDNNTTSKPALTSTLIWLGGCGPTPYARLSQHGVATR